MATKKRQKWQAARHRYGIYYYLGVWDTREEAEAVEADFDKYYPPAHQNRLSV